ncbi:MAG: hypothetical protein IJK81_05205 [Selenomonadaceae bacterium]|nr:hypothetical protein [Selenomonadaceae bacterium]
MSDESDFTSKLLDRLPKMTRGVIFIKSKLNFERVDLFFRVIYSLRQIS